MRPVAVLRRYRLALAFTALLGGVACSDETTIGPGTVVTVRVVPDTVKLAITKTLKIQAFPLDQKGAFVANRKVTWISGDPAIATVDDSGLVTGVGLGSTTVVAKSGEVEGTAVVEISPAPAIGLSSDTASFTAVAQSGATPSSSIAISNTGGVTLTNLSLGTIDYGAGPTGWITAAIDQPTAPANLSLSLSTTGLAMGRYVAIIPIVAPSASNTPKNLTVIMDLVAGPATTMALSAGNNQTSAVNTTVPVAPAVLITDQFGNPVAGQAVTFAVTGGGGSVTGGAATSGTNGVAAVTGWQLGTTVGANTLQATSAGLTGSPVNFSATAIAGGASQIAVNAGNNQSTIAGQTLPTPPSVIVRDQFNNVVSGVAVTFAVATGGGAVTGGAQTTNGSGIATVGSWTLGTTAGANTITATAPGLAGSPVTFTATGTPGPATTIAISAGNGQTAIAGSNVAVAPAVRVADVNNNAVPNVSVTFAVTGGGGAITGGTQTTNASGIATVGSWRLGNLVGANTLSASSAGLTGSPLTFTATGTTGPAAIIAVNAGNNQAAGAGSPVPIAPSVIVTDINTNPVSGVAVTFAVASGGGSLTGGAQTTNASGVATVGSWTLGNTAGTNTLTATSAGLTGSPVTFTATGNPGNAANLALNGGNGQTGTVGSTLPTPLTVLVTDNLANAVQGVTVSWAAANGGFVNCGGGNVASCTSQSNASGIATATWTLGTNAVGTQTATGSVGGLTGSPVNFSATANVGAAATIALNAGNGQSATVNTAVATPPSVRVTDQFGNNVPGVGVTFAVTGGGGSVVGGAATTNASGIATVTSWTLGTTAGANSLNATSAGLTGSPVAFTATGLAGAATQIAVNAGNGQSATVNTNVATPPSVIVRDQFNNPVGGVSVTFAVAGGGGSATGLVQSTTAGGIATVTTWTMGTIAGTNTLTATSAGLIGSPISFTATGTAGAVTTIAVSGGAGQTATVNTAVATAPSVLASDQFGNPVPSVAITFTVTTAGMASNGSVNCGAGALAACNATTNASGIAALTSWILGTTSGTNNNTLSVTRTGATGTSFTASSTPGAVASFSLNSTNNQTQRPGFAVVSAPSVIARDAFSNAVPSVAVTFTVTAGSGSVNCGAGALSTCNVTTNASGVATVTAWIVANGGAPSNGTYANTLATSRTGATTFNFSATARWSFASDVQPIFTGRCTGCHFTGSGQNPNLDAGSSYTAIRGVTGSVPACGAYVAAAFNGSGSSWLYNKISSAAPCGGGSQMPADGTAPMAANLIQIIKDWIDNASPNN